MKKIFRIDDDWFYDFMEKDGLAGCPDFVHTILATIGSDVYVGPKDPVTFEAIATDSELEFLLQWCSTNIPDWGSDNGIPIGWSEEETIKKNRIYRFAEGVIYCDEEDQVWVLEDLGCNFEIIENERIYTHPRCLFFGKGQEVAITESNEKEKMQIALIKKNTS